MAFLPGHDFSDGHTFFFGFVRQHRAAHDIADGIDANSRCFEMIVDGNAAALVELDADIFETQAIGIRFAADRYEHDVAAQHFFFAAGRRFHREHEAFAFYVFDAGYFHAELEMHFLFFQHALELLGDFRIHRAADFIEIFHHGYFRAEPAPDRT